MFFVSLCVTFHLRISCFVPFKVSLQSTAENRKEVLVVQTSYRKEVLELLSCSRKEVIGVSRIQAQAARNQPQEELLLSDAKKVLAHALFLGCTVVCSVYKSSYCGPLTSLL